MSKVVLGIALFCVLAGLYLVTYKGVAVSNDERYLFDSTESFLKRGNFDITYLYDLTRATNMASSESAPWRSGLQEPLQAMLASPLFFFAQNMPHIGLMHTVWLFNIFVVAGTAVALFVAGEMMGYPSSVAWMTGLLFGVATIAWPFSQTFFREPLAGLFTLGAFIAAWKIRVAAQERRSIRHAVMLLLLSLGGIVLTKFALIVILPALLIVMLPSRLNMRRVVWLFAGSAVATAAGIALIFLIGEALDILRLRYAYWEGLITNLQWEFTLESLLGYLISPGRSVWLFSPILIFSIIGSSRSIRRGNWQLPAGALLAFLLVSVSYGVGRGPIWWGGNSWGPRHMVPLIPVFMLLAYPVVQMMLTKGTARYWRVLMGVIVIVSIGVQLLGTLVSINTHYEYLAEQGVLVWQGGLWSWRWSPIPNHLRFLNVGEPDIAWHFSSHPSLPAIILSSAVVLLGVAGSVWLLAGRRLPTRLQAGGLLTLPALLLLSAGMGLYALRDDPRYVPDHDALTLTQTLDDLSHDGDAVVIQSLYFQPTIMNYYKQSALVTTLPYAPGENYDPATDSENLRSQPAENLLGEGTVRALSWLADHYDRVWLVVDTSPAISSELRPTERYLAEHYYPVSSFQIDDTHRIVQFYVSSISSDTPAIHETFMFEDQLALQDYDLPEGTTYQAGEIVPVSLVWSPQQDVSVDYLISVQIARPGEPPVAQRDGLPQGTFGHTSRWESGEQYHDHHGLELPDDLAAGEYRLQVIVYTFPDLERLEVTSSREQSTETDIAVLSPVSIE